MVEVYPGPGKHAEILDHLLALTLSKGYHRCLGAWVEQEGQEISRIHNLPTQIVMITG